MDLYLGLKITDGGIFMNTELSNLWRLIDPQSSVIELRAISEGRSKSMLFPLKDYDTQESRQEEVERVAQKLNEGGMNIKVNN